MSVWYNRKHEIDFWNLDNESHICQNSYKDFGLIPVERPYIAFPESNSNIDSVFATNSRIYTTGYLREGRTYGVRTGEWNFYIDHDMKGENIGDGDSIKNYRKIIEDLNGHKVAVRLADVGRVYKGRLQIEEYDPEDSYSKVRMTYYLESGAVDAADLNLKVVVNWYDYDGTLIYSEIVPVGSTPTVPEIPERDPDDPDNPGTDPTASWDDPTNPTDPTKPVEGNEDHQVSSGKLIVDCGGLYTYESTGRTGNTYEYHYGWVQSPATGKTQHAMLLRGISGQNIFEYCADYDPDAWHPNHSLGYGVQKTSIDSSLQAAAWILACPKAYTEGNYSSTIEGKYTKGTTKLYLDYVNALVFYNNVTPEPTSLVISMFDIYEYDAETETLTIW